MNHGAVVVTGASRGIGRAVAERLLDAGRPVVLVARDRSALLDVASGRDHAHVLVRDLVEDPDVIDKAASMVGELYGVVHAAGLARHAPLADIRDVDLEAMHRLHVVAPLRIAQAFAARSHPGSLVHFTSTLGFRPAPGRIAYSATKAALISLTRSLAIELAEQGIRVNAVAPGVVKTAMTEHLDLEALASIHPLGLGRVGDVADAALFLLDASWMTGTILTIDGGLTAG